MVWLTWRQFRVPALVTIAVLALLAILLGLTGTHLHHLYAAYKTQFASCRADHSDCDLLTQGFLKHYHHLFQYLDTLLVAVPGIIGVFWGPPLLARELEVGSHRLAWTQSVTRTRWLAVKLSLIGAVAAATAGLLSLMVTWWAGPIDHLNADRFAAEIFSVRGLVPLGYAVFAFVLGATLGLVIRRTLPAMAVTLVAYVAVHLAFIGTLRPHLAAATHVILPLSAASNLGFSSGPSGVTFMASGASVPNVLVVSSHLANSAGQRPSAGVLQQFLNANCPSIVANAATPPGPGSPARQSASPVAFNQCVAKFSAKFHESVSYIPASHYWNLQIAETGVYLAASLILVGLCFWWIHRRLG